MDIKLHYTEHGSGDPLILLHGNGEDGTYFIRQIDHFKDRYRVIAVDMIEESHTRLIAESIPGAQLEYVEGSHFVASENPGAFNRVVGAFLDCC